MTPESRRYDTQGLLALRPEAFWELFFDPPDRSNADAGEVAIVTIRDALNHHKGWFDSYEAILERVDAALNSNAKAVVLQIDSPGGECSGCFDTARAIRARADAAGKRLWAYIDGAGCSAAYALACSADRIVVSDTAVVGSIGVICARLDVTEMLREQGVRFTLIKSGARKADGAPVTEMSEAELVETQKLIDALALVFAELVADRRQALDVAGVLGLEAGVFAGVAAVDKGLADSVQSFEAMLTAIVSEGDPTMASKLEEGRAALEEAAQGEGEEAEKAKRALAAMDEEDDDAGDDESDDDSDAETTEEEETVSDDEETTESTSTTGVSGEALTTLADRVNVLEAERTAEKRTALFASRPDVDENMKKLLATMSLEQAEKILAAIPKKAASVTGAAATGVVRATRGETQGSDQLPSSEAAELDEKMGLARPAHAVRNVGNRLILGVMTSADSRAFTEAKAKAAASKTPPTPTSAR